MKTKKKTNVPGTSRALYSTTGEHLGSVTEWTDGTFLAYLPEVGGPFLKSRADAEAFIEKQATDAVLMNNKHSDKAIKTLADMGTVGTDWKQTDIRWVYEMVDLPRPVECPTCRGEKRVFSKPDVYEPVNCPAEITDFYARQDWFRANTVGLRRVNCKTCERYKRPGKWTGGGFISTGTVLKVVKVKVLVGYPIWPEGTRFDSRFRSAVTDRHCCELCSKSLASYQVPVVGKGADGTTHGMWVGTDCAKKFLAGLQIRPPAEHKGEEFIMSEEAPTA